MCCLYGQFGKFYGLYGISMKEIRKTSQFKKDFKCFSKDLNKVNLLYAIVAKLANGENLPAEFNPHQLKGEWKNYMECHVEDDYLLIWYDKDECIIKLVRLGSHSELFGKRSVKLTYNTFSMVQQLDVP